ncbi:MAG TPA: porin [Quisquiliibacterium sp.]|nr:porin [Quisquiliibacterium sp.]
MNDRRLPPKRLHAARLRLAALAICACATHAPARAQEAPVPFDFYGKLYPEWLMQRFGTPSTKGTDVGNMGTLRNDTTVLAKDASPKDDFDDHEWSNSYVAVRGRGAGRGLDFGYDLQALIDLQGNVIDNLRTRDAFAYVGTPTLGRLAVGRMDSIYKEFGDRVRMLGIASGNFVSTSRVLSGVGWRGRGETTFHNRRSNMLTWYGPRWGDVDVGVSHSFDAANAAPGTKATLSAAGMRWRSGPWYAALATEVHRDWLPVSLGNLDAAPAAESILNRAASASSRDQAWRMSFAWSNPAWRVATDWARLKYTETDAVDLPGKFRNYRNNTWQLSAEYKWSSELRLSANHARGTAGSCTLSAEVACSTEGLGGHQTSLGAMYRLGTLASVFALASRFHNGDAAYYGSAPQGGSVQSYAVGVKIEY